MSRSHHGCKYRQLLFSNSLVLCFTSVSLNATGLRKINGEHEKIKKPNWRMTLETALRRPRQTKAQSQQRTSACVHVWIQIVSELNLFVCRRGGKLKPRLKKSEIPQTANHLWPRWRHSKGKVQPYCSCFWTRIIKAHRSSPTGRPSPPIAFQVSSLKVGYGIIGKCCLESSGIDRWGEWFHTALIYVPSVSKKSELRDSLVTFTSATLKLPPCCLQRHRKPLFSLSQAY